MAGPDRPPEAARGGAADRGSRQRFVPYSVLRLSLHV